MTNLLVTGGAGFIGSALVRQFIEHTDAHIANVDKLTYAGNLESLGTAHGHPRHCFIHGDICDPTTLRRVFEEAAPDGVFHLAAESHVDRSIDGPAEFIKTNLVGTYILLQEALAYWRSLEFNRARQFRIVHVSTDEVYGSLGECGVFTEESPYNPSSPYSASKAGADHLARAWQRTYGLPVIVTNCSNNYGPYQFPDKLIPLTIMKALGGEAIPVYGRGENVRDWLHVDDHVRALRLVLHHGVPGRTYNIGGHNERKNIDVVRAICRLLDEFRPDPVGSRERLIQFVADRPGHDLRYALDASRLRDELGWSPHEDFEPGLRKTIAWYLDHMDWVSRVMSGSYQGQRLGTGTGM